MFNEMWFSEIIAYNKELNTQKLTYTFAFQ